MLETLKILTNHESEDKVWSREPFYGVNHLSLPHSPCCAYILLKL